MLPQVSILAGSLPGVLRCCSCCELRSLAANLNLCEVYWREGDGNVVASQVSLYPRLNAGYKEHELQVTNRFIVD